MKQGSKTVTRNVKVLKNPNPTYVSLVEHGAIQEPFKVLKKADPKGHSMAIKKREDVTKTEGKTAVRKIVFDNSKFDTEESVRKYLDENKWSDYTVVAKDGTWIAEGKDVTDADFVEKTIKSVKMVDDGSVLGYVGKLVEKSEDADGKTKTTKTETKQERAIKMSYWDMYSSDDQTVEGVIKDGMKDGVPPGCAEIIQATAYAMANVLKAAPAERKSMIKSIGGEFAELINATADLYEGVITEKAVKNDNTKKFAETFRAEVGGIIEAVENGERPNVEKKDDKTTKTETKPEDRTTKTEPVVEDKPAKKDGEKEDTVQAPAPIDMTALASLIGKAVTDAVAPVKSSVDDLTKKVDTVQGIAEDARNKATKAADEVSAVASQAPMKKSASEQGASKSEVDRQEAEKSKKEAGLRNFGNALGIRAR